MAFAFQTVLRSGFLLAVAIPLSAAAQSGRKGDAAIRAYLEFDSPAKVTNVTANGESITISGMTPPDGDRQWQVIELSPHVSSIDAGDAVVVTPLNSLGEFRITVDRFVEGRDRLLSRWAITDSTNDYILSGPARYVTDSSPPRLAQARSKKGMAGVHAGDDLPELIELGVSHITVNVHFENLVTLKPEGGIEHQYGGNSYYFSPEVVARFDKVFSFATQHDMVSSAILLVPRMNRKSELGRLLTHPAAVEGHFSMPNLTTAQSAQLFAAVIDFLASRYSGSNADQGKITNWILGNEVDAGWVWTNAGELTAHEYMDQYVRALRMVHTIARAHNPQSQAFISLTHSWTQPIEPSPLRFYPGRELLEILQRYCEVEGDFDWGVAYHPYPQDLFQPRFWQDSVTRDDFDSPKITFNNIEVLDRWFHQPRFLYDGKVRTVLLSEQGFHTPDYSEEAERVQAAALALSWRKVQPLDSIQAYHYHRWIDNPHEGGLRLGIRRLADPNAEERHPKKFSWNVFRALGTPDEAAAVEFAEAMIQPQP